MLSTECQAALDQLDAMRRGELSGGELQTLMAHLDSCLRCHAYERHEAAFLDRLITAARNATCPDDLRATIYQMIAKESRDN
jgi:hypothetical protein